MSVRVCLALVRAFQQPDCMITSSIILNSCNLIGLFMILSLSLEAADLRPNIVMFLADEDKERGLRSH